MLWWTLNFYIFYCCSLSVPHKEIHSPAPLNNLNKSSRGLYKHPREAEKVSLFMSCYILSHETNKKVTDTYILLQTVKKLDTANVYSFLVKI